jgi:HlyD family secretion protein
MIRALGTVRPAQTLRLSFGTGGPVKTVYVRKGERVEAGDLIAELDTAALALDRQSAQAEVDLYRATLEDLVGSPDRIVIERAEAENTQQMTQAEIALRIAQLQLEQARLQDHGPAIAIAQAGVAHVDRQLAQARASSPTAEVTVAQVDLARAQERLDDAQIAYQQALDRPWEPQETRDALAKALQRARWEVQAAQVQLDAALSAQRAHALGLEALATQGNITRAQLTQAQNARAVYTVTLTVLAAQVEQAQATLDGLRTWTNPLRDPVSPEQTAQARARLRQAELAVYKIEGQLAKAELYAPYDGIISAVHVSAGEWADAGVPAVAVLDTRRWYVETRNVGELDIGRVSEGQEAVVRVMAFEGEALHGRVDVISPVAVVQQGDTTYTLMIALDATDLNLRPGMNAQVDILTE